MKVQLISPQPGSQFVQMPVTQSYPPLGILTLATCLRETYPRLELQVFDGALTSQADIIRSLDADLVGISVNLFNYTNGLEIASRAKEAGSSVVMGGPHATTRAWQILERQKAVDFVVVGDGEEAIVSLAAGGAPEDTSNLLWRDASGIRATTRRSVRISQRPRPVRSWLPMAPYFANFVRENPQYPFRRPMQVQTQKGCFFRKTQGACVFCARIEDEWYLQSSDQAWDEIRALTGQYGADMIWDIADAFTSSQTWLRRFAASRPQDLSPGFLVFARADELSEDQCDSLARLNTFAVILGVESGSSTVLAQDRKQVTKEQVRTAVRRLSARGIGLVYGFILGLPGETPESLNRTAEFAMELASEAYTISVVASPFIPLPGSPSFDLLLADESVPKKLGDLDIFSLRWIQELWLDRFTLVGWDEVERLRETLEADLPNVMSLGLEAGGDVLVQDG